ncbi:ribonucleotide reductase N-terminal alpha domain-containing protein [Longimicrobium sp.]|uniref:ribonucleotide reductase N-terminal alpha domain-containing protein n=1 Tax=Longimicrobium sp. TaxID=2029185 RepID=UPI002B9EB27B|nr:ribonucleotide reductase N-terminal alpha domain-containing protein [Longimicrobium sp.]HSU16948.1 ribonucleotide reductase N-terminal alpha domain-containing protein [Longimicrobium sp.]
MNPPTALPSVADAPVAAIPADLPRAELSDNARIVLAKRYLKKDESGKPTEGPEEMFWRVAYTIASADRRYGASEDGVVALAREFYALMTKRLFEPNSPTLMNAGRPLGQLSACFVLPVDDELSNGGSGIYDTLKSMALVHQSGGGTGFSFSRIRPAGDHVRSTTGVASGPISFMSLYDASTEVVKQGGTRRGANMGILRVDHPNVEEFIDCKQDITKITNFNISVAITDAFMNAVERGAEYDLINPRNGQVAGRKDARRIFDKIVENAWRTGEPGVFFIDRANFYNPVPHLGAYEATNPCLTGDTQVLTVEGPRRFDELAASGDDVLVYAFDRLAQAPVVRWMRRPRLTRRDVEVIEIEFDSGLTVRCTPDHNWIGLNGEKIPAGELRGGVSVRAYAVAQLQERPAATAGNHKVVAVRLAGRADVYNGTVDDVHTYVVADPHAVEAGAAFTGVVSANCGEQPLLPYDVCNLGSVNVGAFVRSDVPADSPWYERVDWKEYRRVTRLSTHFLDNVIDANQYPLPEITDLANRIRRIGLGVMGFADLLVRLGVPYNSEEGVEIGRRVMEFLDEEGKKASEQLAESRGAFPEWEKSIWGPDDTCARAPNGDRIRPMRRLRNCNVTTVAPTGTISIFAGCSSGIEPLFAVAFMRNQAGAMMPDVNEDFVAVAKAGGWYSEGLVERIAREGHIHFPEVPAAVQKAFVTAHDITPEWHVRMQAGFQEHCDSAISKTTNFPHEATVEDVREIYELAFRLGTKGVTVYRDGSRDGQVLSTGATKTPAQQQAEVAELVEVRAKAAEVFERGAKLEREVARLREELKQAEFRETQIRRHKRKRPSVLRGTTRKMGSPLGDVFVTINEDDQNHPFEVFATLGKAGSVAMADVEAIGRLISLALRFGIPVNEVYTQLRGISSDKAIGFGANKVHSVPDAIAQAIGLREQEKAGVQQELIPEAVLQTENAADLAMGFTPATESSGPPQLTLDYHGGETFMGTCPECKSQLEFAEGCMKCHVCGFSECG